MSVAVAAVVVVGALAWMCKAWEAEDDYEGF